MSPLFLEDYNHYFPLSYFTVNLYSIFIGSDSIFSYWMLSLLLRALSPLVVFLIVRRIFFVNRLSLIIIVVFLFSTLDISLEFNPNSISILFIYLTIFLLLQKKNKPFLVSLFIFTIANVHIFFLFFFFLFFLLSFTYKKIPKIGIFFTEKIYLRFEKIPKINPNLIIINLLLFFYIFSKVDYWVMSEISIEINMPVGLLGLGFIPFIISQSQRRSLPVVFSITVIYLIMLFMYITWLWLFHSQYFSNFFTKLILTPGVIIFFIKSFSGNRINFLQISSFLILLVFPLYYRPFLNAQASVNKQEHRIRLNNEFGVYKETFYKKVLFMAPGDFINRYISVDFDTYIYAVHFWGYPTIWSRPFTTIPHKKLSKFPQFFHADERMYLADKFLINPNMINFANLQKFQLDYFIIPLKNVPPYNYLPTRIFLWERMNKNIIGETKNYVIYKN